MSEQEGMAFSKPLLRFRPMTMAQVNGAWLFTDERRDIWRLEPTGDPNMPLRISIVERCPLDWRER